MPLLRPLMGADVELVDSAQYYEDAPHGVRVNMIVSLDGAAAFDGTVGPLSDPVDLDLLISLRAYADVVLVGAGTVRAEHYGPVRLRPEQLAYRHDRWGLDSAPGVAVVTATGDLPWTSTLFTDGPRQLVVTTRRVVRARGNEIAKVADIVVGGEDTVDVRDAIAALKDRGLHRILCEGGPILLDELVAHDLVDDMCLTVAPRFAGLQPQLASCAPTLHTPRTLSLRHVLTKDNFLYLRYSR